MMLRLLAAAVPCALPAAAFSSPEGADRKARGDPAAP